MKTIRITWNGTGGELDHVIVEVTTDDHGNIDDYAVSNALVKMVQGNIVTAGDVFIVSEIA